MALEEKLARSWQPGHVNRAMMLSPILGRMPLPIQRHDDPFLPWGKAIIDATRDLVVAYTFDLAAYLAIGAAGAIALERTIAYANGDGKTATILHGPFVGDGYAQTALAFGVDAVTCVSNARGYLAAGMSVILLTESGSLSGSLVDGWLVAGDRSLLNIPASVAYAGSGEDFAERVRTALQSWRHMP